MTNIKKALDTAMSGRDTNISEVAKQCGYTRTALYNMFYYRRNPTVKTIERVAACFDMSTSEFIKLGE